MEAAVAALGVGLARGLSVAAWGGAARPALQNLALRLVGHNSNLVAVGQLPVPDVV